MGGRFFKRYQWLEHEIASSVEERTLWKQRSEQYALKKFRHIEQKISANMDELELMKTEINRLLRHMPAKVAAIMRYRYINGWSAEKIAEKLYYSRSHIYRLIAIGEKFAEQHTGRELHLDQLRRRRTEKARF